jgi:hypothetical protein
MPYDFIPRLLQPANSKIVLLVLDGLGGLPGKIAEIKEFRFGKDVIRSERSYDLGLVSSFDDLDALERYQVHPEHQKVLAIIKANISGVVAVDFEE